MCNIVYCNIIYNNELISKQELLKFPVLYQGNIKYFLIYIQYKIYIEGHSLK